MCDVRFCRKPVSYVYYQRGVCEDHWIKHCSSSDEFNLKKEFEINEVI